MFGAGSGQGRCNTPGQARGKPRESPMAETLKHNRDEAEHAHAMF